MDFLKRPIAAFLSVCRSHWRSYPRSWRAGAVLVIAFLLGGFFLSISPPAEFTLTTIDIPQGTSAPEAARILTDAHIVKHPSLLRFFLRISGTDNSVQAGMYRFSTPQNLFTVAYRIVTGGYGLPPVRITFFEGETVRDDAERVENAFSFISATTFERAAREYEGYLFPDTYTFPPGTDTATILKTMRDNFNAKLEPLTDDIGVSGHSLVDIITMASLIEKEVRTSANRRIVSGILWNRIKLGMPLQVDAVFGYIFNRDTYSPSYEDLKVDSPYNTYTHIGLPPGPIDNPGLDAIDAALYPAKTKYLYYLTGTDNQMHYATTYAGHQANQRKYLR